MAEIAGMILLLLGGAIGFQAWLYKRKERKILALFDGYKQIFQTERIRYHEAHQATTNQELENLLARPEPSEVERLIRERDNPQ